MRDWNVNRLQVTGGLSLREKRWVYVSLRGRAAWAPFEKFHFPASEAMQTLARQNVTVIGDDKARLIRLVQDLDEFEPMPLLERPGWNGPYYVFPDGTPFGPRNAPAAEVVFEKWANKTSRAGTLAGWQKEVAIPLTGQTLWEFGVGLVFAGPLLTVYGKRENPGFELFGQKGTGKSTLQLFLASAVGRAVGGSEDRYWVPLLATAGGLEEEMPAHSDAILIGEEMNLFANGESKRVRAAKIEALTWQLSRGAEKKRKDGLRTSEYHFVFMVCTNEALVDMLKRYQEGDTADAVSDRLISLAIDKADRLYGTFDFIPDRFAGAVDFARSIERGMEVNYGLAMPAFIERLVTYRAEDEERFVQRLRDHVQRFCNKVGVNPNDGSAYRVAETFGLGFAGGSLAKFFGVLPPGYDPMRSAIACYDLYKATIRQRLPIEERLARIAADQNVIDLDNGLFDPSASRLATVSAFVKTTTDGRQVWLTKKQLDRHFPDWKSIWKSSAMEAVLVSQNGRKANVGRVRRGGKQVRLYRFQLRSDA